MTRKDKETRAKEVELHAEQIRSSVNAHFGAMTDPRRLSRISHKLLDILFITLCAILSGANDLPDIALYAKQ